MDGHLLGLGGRPRRERRRRGRPFRSTGR